ncbi:cytochrome P450 [Actinoplanes sp. NPDC051411]|uniref:cytochrome P450 n=1 Tax=Actinoplanes sp. NPDC051411 TaxID=3155522 RepID=UPI00341FC8F0
MVPIDQSLLFTLKGYAWLPDLRRRANGRPVPLRVLGQRAVAIGGPEAARFFYAEGNLQRHTALPHPVVATLFGRGAVHTLDGPAHRHRKAMFVDLLTGDGVDRLAALAEEEFEAAARRWRGGPEVSLFDETARIIAAAVTRWAGVPETQRDPAALPADLLAMVDGFASLGPRHARALAARRRRESWLAAIIEDVRREHGPRSPLTSIAHHREDGRLLDPRTAAVEVLNVIRPATAVTWLVTFAAHALDQWPHLRNHLERGDYARAFAHEVRRFYPFTPFLGGRATRDLRLPGARVDAGTLVLLDVYGQHHDERVWPEPYAFCPERFLGRPIGEFELIPQGGGDPRTGHRCPGEQITIALLSALARKLAALDYYLPPQRTGIDLGRVPARPRDGIRIVVPVPVRTPSRSPGPGGR